MALADDYAKEIREQTRFLATWLPNQTIMVGDVGVVRNGIFTKSWNLRDKGIALETADGAFAAEMTLKASSVVEVSFKGEGQASRGGIAKGEAGWIVDFGKKSGFVLDMAGCDSRVVANGLELNKTILALHKAKEFALREVVVSEVVTSAATILVLSSESGGKVGLKAEGELQGTGSLAKGGVGFSRASGNVAGLSCLAPVGTTPLFRARGLKDGVFGGDPWVESAAAAAYLRVSPELDKNAADAAITHKPAFV